MCVGVRQRSGMTPDEEVDGEWSPDNAVRVRIPLSRRKARGLAVASALTLTFCGCGSGASRSSSSSNVRYDETVMRKCLFDDHHVAIGYSYGAGKLGSSVTGGIVLNESAPTAP